MPSVLLVISILAVIADAFLSASVIYHLRRYSLPGWTLTKVVIPVYLVSASLFMLLALWWLWIIYRIA